MNKFRNFCLFIIVCVLIEALGVVCLAHASDSMMRDERVVMDIQSVLGEVDNNEYQQADPAYLMRFPEDHGVHPEFRNEWWYLTGHLQDDTGREFGFQFTLFRYALSAQIEPHPSAWKTNQIYMAHLALSDIETGRFLHHERFSRDSIGLAGAQAQPFKVWMHDWILQSAGEDSEPPWELEVAADEFTLSLMLTANKPRVLQGEQGFSQKGSGGASLYYSYTRLATNGEVMLDGETYQVRGFSWLDREWGSGALSRQQIGWDWFSLQMDNGDDIMWYQLRLQDGSIDQHSKGIVVDSQGSTRPLDVSALIARPLEYWQSPDQRCYPISWQLTIDGRQDLTIVPKMKAQWWDDSFKYWEGAVDVLGSVAGRGYLELSGYQPQAECP